MAKGIIYIMETVVPGLIKIGKTASNQFENRMYNLERNGYNNVVGLKRRFAIEVDEYDEKETLLHSLFDKSRLQNSELFAVDVDLVIQLLTSFEGKQVYPEDVTKAEVFAEATENRQENIGMTLIPDGIYIMKENRRRFGTITAKMRVENGKFIVLKGSICAPVTGNWSPAVRRAAIIENNTLMEDVECDSPSTAGWIPLGKANNGWLVWKTTSGKPIDMFRNQIVQDN